MYKVPAAHCLIMVYICTKFCKNILIGFKSYGTYTISILIIIKGNNLVKTVHRITVLVLCISCNHGPHLYHVWQKYQAMSELWSQNAFDIISHKGHNSLNIIHGVKVLFSAHHLIMVYICTKFRENILNGFRVSEHTQFQRYYKGA